jgi:AcrR family transcriptional regulator
VNRWPSDEKPEKIRNAALSIFAAQGVGATSLREVAAAADVSIGLIQHHFGTKAGLVDAVDRHVTEVIRTTLGSGPGSVTVDDFGEQVTALLVQHTTVVDYLARALVEDTPFGSTIFHTLIEMGTARWERRAEEGLTRPGLDTTWAALNIVLLFFGTVLLRPHVDRLLGEALLSQEQLDRWGLAVKELMRRGQMK